MDTLSLDWISRAFRRANTWMWLDTCLRVRVLPVRSLMYLAINSFRPENKRQKKLLIKTNIGIDDALIIVIVCFNWKKRKAIIYSVDFMWKLQKKKKCSFHSISSFFHFQFEFYLVLVHGKQIQNSKEKIAISNCNCCSCSMNVIKSGCIPSIL